MRLAALDFSRTRLSPSRPITDYAKVRELIARFRRNARWQLTPSVLSRDYLDIGCGPNMHPEFINLDWEWRPGMDLVWDVTKGIPLPNSHLAGVFSEHTFEHLPVAATEAALTEVRRVLKPGGTVRIVVPNLEVYVRQYVAGGPMPYAEQDAKRFPFYTPATSINRIMREHGHLFIYDFDTMAVLCERAGFRQVQEARFGQGRDPLLAARDTAARAIESLYVEAVKH